MKVLVLILVLIVLAGCSTEDAELEVEVPSITTNIIPNLSFPTCTDKREAADEPTGDPNVFYLNRIKFKWSNTKYPLSITSISVKLNSANFSGGVFEHYMPFEEIDWLFTDSDFTEVTGASPSLARTILAAADENNPREVITAEDCEIIIPGLAFVDKTKMTSVSGTLKVTAVYKDDDNYYPVTATASVSGLYVP